MFEKISKLQIIILSLILSVTLVFCAFIISKNISKNEITVTGSAFELVDSDSGKWNFNIQTYAPSRLGAYKKLEHDVPLVIKFLKDNGFKDSDIEEIQTTSWERYKTNSSGNLTQDIAGYNYQKEITVTSNDVELIKSVYLKSPSLVEIGVEISSSQPQYFYSKLADKKLDLLQKATLDAKNRADGMLKATRNHTGKIHSVRMGVFQITPSDSNEVSDWGINDSSTIKKKITAVANVVFAVE